MADTLRGRLIPLVLCCVSGGIVSGHSLADDGLPPLRVDPALLGPLPARTVAAPVALPLPAVSPRATAQVVPLPALLPPVAAATSFPIERPPRKSRRGKAAKAATSASPVREVPPLAAAGVLAPPSRRETDPAPGGAASVDAASVAAAPLLPREREALNLPPLKASTRLTPLKRDTTVARPTFVVADQLTRVDGNQLVAIGDADLRRIGNALKADQITYWQDEDEVEAVGRVRLTTNDDVITGPKMRRKLDQATGYFEQPTYTLNRTPPPGQVLPAANGSGHADRIDFLGENLFHLVNGTYTSCQGPDPDWYARSRDMMLDFNQGEGDGKDGTLFFKNVPILYSPWLDFPLNNSRKSGFLAPTVGTTSTSGFEVIVPWYWNISPNMDATITPRIMTKRGVQLSTEFRYMDRNFSGADVIEVLPRDNLTGQSRALYSIVHTHNLGEGFSANLNLNKVSDDAYFTDLAKPISGITTTTQTTLVRQGTLSYGSTWWNSSFFVQRYQTLQDPITPVSVPYDRLPAATLNATRPEFLGGTSLAVNGTFDAFRVADPTDSKRINGNRTVLYPQISWPYQTAAYTFTPKFGYHVTNYTLSNVTTPGDPTSISRQVPIFSLDSSVVFERDSQWRGLPVTQTLEPRIFYLRVPSRDQTKVPLFDTALADFNFAQIFSENLFVGSDRIADANQLTAALTSRVIRQEDGAELIRMALGQRYYFRNQTVTLNATDVPRTSSKADILAAVSGQFLPKTWADAAWQYNPRDSHTERFSIGGRYQPELFKVINASYRFQRDTALGANDGLRDFDVSAQWPLWNHWYGVGRYNYSLHDRRLVEALGGLEYDGGCWVGRIVMQRFVTSTLTANTTLFLQLELNGFSRLGSDPLDALRRSVSGYGRLNDPRTVPVLGGSYF